MKIIIENVNTYFRIRIDIQNKSKEKRNDLFLDQTSITIHFSMPHYSSNGVKILIHTSIQGLYIFIILNRSGVRVMLCNVTPAVISLLKHLNLFAKAIIIPLSSAY